MGAFGEAFAAYVEPLIAQTDGSKEQIEKAFMIGQVCWTIAMAPSESRAELITSMQESFNMSDEEYLDFVGGILMPMVQRYYEMFPDLHKKPAQYVTSPTFLDRMETMDEMDAPEEARNDAYPGTPPNAPCPCYSGKKYKRCCGRKDR